MTDTADFFPARLSQMIVPSHSLLVLELHMLWQEIGAALAHRFVCQARRGKKLKGLGLFGPTTTIVGAGVSNAGRSRLSLRFMASMQYLKHAFHESDENVCHRWGEMPAWQYFSGEDYFENRPPCDPSSISRFRRLLGEEGVEELLAPAISVAITLRLIDVQEFARVIVDSAFRPTGVGTNLGYRGIDWEHPSTRLNHCGKLKRLTPLECQLLKRRQTIEPVISHLKDDRRIDRYHLKG